MSKTKPMTKATFKDILYALEYGGESLLKTFNHVTGQQYWTFAKSGRPVDKDAANKFMADPHCAPNNDGLFQTDSQSFGWRE